jgi:nucleotide-binding universal stress UspA family protein
MFDEILACLDGSPLAETILPVARAISAATAGQLTLLRVVADAAELSSEENHLRDCARQYGAQRRFLVGSDPAAAIAAELEAHPRAIAALTTHGRTAWTEALLGSVALRVISQARRPVIIYHPMNKNRDVPKRINTLVAALDGSEFSEKIIPHAVKAAQSLSAKLTLIQVLPSQITPAPRPEEKIAVSEANYLHWKAAETKARYGIAPHWEILHGDPAEAICRYLHDLPETMLALTTHGRSGLKRALLGSVAAACIRRAGVPLLLYWPQH